MDKLPAFPAFPKHLQATTTNFLSVIMARKRLLVFLFVPLVLIALLFTGTVSDSEWSQSLGNGLKSGVSYVTGDGKAPGQFSSGGVTYVSGNSSLGHGTTKFWKSKAYKRPGYELPLADGMPLRIMALGASTTRGDSPEKGIDNNGFRRPLREKLTKIGNPVNFVGTQRLGNMTDNDIEAYPGVPTHRIHFHAKKAVPARKPNLFLINAGSNDCFQHIDIDNFYKRYDALVQYCLKASPRSTVILSTILPTWDKRFNGREDVWRVNPQIRRLAKIYQEQGKPVVLAELQGPDGVQDQNLAEDGMHPGTAGYEMMATKMFEAIVEADARGFLQTPEPIMGILDDGDEERKDDAYFAHLEQHWAIENATMKAEQAEMDRMKAELAAMYVQEQEKQAEAQTTKHSRRNREHRFPQMHVV
ncbi:putative carbohydrate esterase family 3 protein [Rosellinia necatrix]|uniref:Putative carbohydrate esterase family 3 protein n=1 Tax=Rosellinia necatrix TaxID=77044 RepID=A0A1W2TAE1_ROSNE|nr:putative carbohydrate esterase family 3 protein [Rosellinia necatrix]